jgi:excinuclease UvrABC nuclease subunit
LIDKRFFDGFDAHIIAPGFNVEKIKSFFKGKGKVGGVYAVYDLNYEPLYIGHSKDLGKRLPQHLHQNQLKGHFDRVLFISVKYAEKDLERQYIKEFNPLLNKYYR